MSTSGADTCRHRSCASCPAWSHFLDGIQHRPFGGGGHRPIAAAGIAWGIAWRPAAAQLREDPRLAGVGP